MQLLLTAQLPVETGGLGGAALCVCPGFEFGFQTLG